MREYIEVICISALDAVEEMSRKLEEEFEFVAVIVKNPDAFLLRMSRKTPRRTKTAVFPDISSF